MITRITLWHDDQGRCVQVAVAALCTHWTEFREETRLVAHDDELAETVADLKALIHPGASAARDHVGCERYDDPLPFPPSLMT